MTHDQQRTGLEPQISAASGRRSFVIDEDDAPQELTGFEPELGGIRRATTDPHIMASLLSSADSDERQRAIALIQSEEQNALYARELAAIIPRNARRRIAGLWTKHYTKHHRLNAIDAISMLGQHSLAIPPLFNALGDSDDTIRKSAIIALANLWNMPTLLLLTHHMPRYRISAALRLASRADPRTIAPLLVSLHDQDDMVRAAIANALGALHAQHATQDLLKLLKDPEWLVREAASEALGTIATDLAPDDPQLQEMLTLLTSALHTGTLVERQAAIQTLSHIADPDSILEPLTTALEDRDQSIQIAAATALGELDDERAFQPLANALSSNTFPHRAIIRALTQLGDERAIPLLLDILQNNKRLRIAAAFALTTFDNPHVIEGLATILNLPDSPPQAQHAASLALHRINSPRQPAPSSPNTNQPDTSS